MDKKILKFATITGLIIIAALTRLFEHPANVSPIMAISIFAGYYFSDKKYALLIPLAAMLISDIFIGFHSTLIFVYVGFAVGIFIGYVLKNRLNVKNLVLSSLAGSLSFFLITNFGSWLADPIYYPLNFESLVRCYTMAIPFFRNTLIGDASYITVLFGSMVLAERFIPVLRKSQA